MSVEVKCSSCQKMTAVGRLICQHCGQKLQTIKPGDLKKSTKKDPVSYGGKKEGSLLGSLISMIMIIALGGGLGLFMWPVHSTGTEGAEEELKSGDDKLQVLFEGIENGVKRKVVITEEEVNAYLKDLQDSAPEGAVEMKQMMVNLQEGQIEIIVQTGLGPATMARELVFIPEVRDGFIKPKVVSARFGHLPMPGPLGDFVKDNVSKVFGDMEREDKIWNNTESITVEDGQLTIQTYIN